MVNIADIADGDQISALMAAGPDARRDAVIAMTAERIAARGFTEQPTAHNVLRTPLPLRIDPGPGIGIAV